MNSVSVQVEDFEVDKQVLIHRSNLTWSHDSVPAAAHGALFFLFLVMFKHLGASLITDFLCNSVYIKLGFVFIGTCARVSGLCHTGLQAPQSAC